MSNDLSTDWLRQSLLRLSPNVFFHNIWKDFVSTNVSFAPELIEELNQTAERLVVGEDLISACQTWLICAVLKSQLGDYPAALAFVEKTAEFAQEHHLPQINSWANWGASALCARQGHWQQSATYLQRLQEVLNQQNDWMLASVINILETSLSHLDATKPTPSTLSVDDSQLDIAFEQLLHWEEPIQTLLSDSSKSDDGRSSSWRSFWQTVTGFFRGKTDSQPLHNTIIPSDVASAIRPHERPPPSLAPPQLTAPEQPQADESSIPVRATVTDVSPSAEGMMQLEKRPFTYPQTATKRQLSLPIERETQTKTEPIVAPKHNTPSLSVYCLGSFRVYQDEKPIEQWPSGKGKLIFKYLLTHRQQPIGKEVLMDQFWPEANPDAARNNLNVAIYGLRQALRNGYEQFSHVLFQDDHYLLNPELHIWVDYELFLDLWQTAEIHQKQEDWVQAIRDYNAAASLYQGEFLAEDRYEEWLLPLRQQLEDAYLNLLENLSHHHFQNETYAACIEACRHILAVEPCRESTHRQLMRCYCRQGQYYLGLRQYHQCVEALHNELEVTPSPQTTHLYERIRHHEPV